MSRRTSTRLSDKQLEAVRLLMLHRDMGMTEKATSAKAINRTTAWGLEEAGVVDCNFFGPDLPMKERVKLRPVARQLISLGRTAL